MIVFRTPDEVPDGFGPSVVAIGKFDGVHAGHRAVIERMKVDATGEASTVAVTFDRHPLSILAPEKCPPSLLGVEQKLQLLGETGIDATLILTFDESMAAVEPEDFVTAVLVDALHAQTVMVGSDFRFGGAGGGSIGMLRQLGTIHGFDVDEVDDVRSLGGGRRVSSTWIRELLDEGDVSGAAKLLGRLPSVRGEVVHGLGRGRELGFPTANLSQQLEGFVPADGVYAGWLIDEGWADRPARGSSSDARRRVRYPAAISVGVNPTFDDVHARQVEAYVLDENDLNLYGRRVEVQFARRIRGMVAFEGIDALIAQIADDVERVREELS